MPSLLLRGLRHTQSKEEEEVTSGLLGVVQLPCLSLQSLLCCLCWSPGLHLSLWIYPSAGLEAQGKGLNPKAALQEKQGTFKSQKNLPEASQVTVFICRTVVSSCSSSEFQEVTHTRTIKIPIRGVCVDCWKPFLGKAQLQAEGSGREQLNEAPQLMGIPLCSRGSSDPGVC